MRCVTESAPIPRSACSQPRWPIDLWLCVALLLLLNLPLFVGEWSSRFTFLPRLVGEGEWWRVLTAPFVHNSLYHLFVDGVAFVLLYTALRQKPAQRLTVLCASALGGLLVPLWLTPVIRDIGLCGMSGVAHGLMAICSLEMGRATNGRVRAVGYLSFAFLIAKCIAEAVTGRLIFDLVHFGNVGVPIVTCHAGGALGALIACPLLTISTEKQSAPQAGEETRLVPR